MADELTKQELMSSLLTKHRKKLVRTLKSTVHQQTSGINYKQHGLIGLGLKHGVRAVAGVKSSPRKTSRLSSDDTQIISSSGLEGPVEQISKKLDSIIEVMKGDSLQKKEDAEEQSKKLDRLDKNKDSGQPQVSPTEKKEKESSGSGMDLGLGGLLSSVGMIASTIIGLVPIIAGIYAGVKLFGGTNPTESPKTAYGEKLGVKTLTSGARALGNTDASVGKVWDAFKTTKEVAKPTEEITKIGGAATKNEGALNNINTLLGKEGNKEAAKIGEGGEAAANVLKGTTKEGAKEAEKAAGHIIEKTTEKSVAKIAAKESEKAAMTVGKGVLKEGGKLVGKGIGKFASKALPGVGLAMGAMFAVDRAKEGDYLGATLEMVSGIAGLVPGIGTAVALATDAFLLGRDIFKAQKEKDTGDANTNLAKKARDKVSNDESLPSELRDYSALTQQGEDLTEKLREDRKKAFTGDEALSNQALYMKMQKGGVESLTKKEKEKAASSGLLDLFNDEELKKHIEDQKKEMLSSNPDLQKQLDEARGSKQAELTSNFDSGLKGYSESEIMNFNTGKMQKNYWGRDGENLTPEQISRVQSLSESDRQKLQSGQSLEPVSSSSLDKKAATSQAIDQNAQTSNKPVVVSTVDNSQTTVSAPSSSPGWVTPMQSIADSDTRGFFSNYSLTRPAY